MSKRRSTVKPKDPAIAAAEKRRVPCLGFIGQIPLVTLRPIDQLPQATKDRITAAEFAYRRGDFKGASRVALAIESEHGITAEDRIAAVARRDEEWEDQLEHALGGFQAPPPKPVKVRQARKAKTPKTPAEVREAAFAACDMPVGSAFLPANADIDASDKTRDHAARARRMDGIEALRATFPPGVYDALRKLESAMLTAAGEGDKGRANVRVDDSTNRDVIDIMLRADAEVRTVMAKIGPRMEWLMRGMVTPAVQIRLSVSTWRGVVGHIMGEEDPHAQAACVRMLGIAVADAYQMLMQAA